MCVCCLSNVGVSESIRSVAFVQAGLSYTHVFVFYFINNLCSVELVNKNIKYLLECHTVYFHLKQVKLCTTFWNMASPFASA